MKFLWFAIGFALNMYFDIVSVNLPVQFFSSDQEKCFRVDDE